MAFSKLVQQRFPLVPLLLLWVSACLLLSCQAQEEEEEDDVQVQLINIFYNVDNDAQPDTAICGLEPPQSLRQLKEATPKFSKCVLVQEDGLMSADCSYNGDGDSDVVCQEIERVCEETLNGVLMFSGNTCG